MSNTRPIIIWLLTGCILIFTMVIIGGITRLTNSGLSMVEWKLISGTLPPLNEESWNEAFEKYKAFPEYQQINTHFTLNEFKSIFWWEYIHRVIGRLLGIVFILPYLYFQWKKKISNALNKRLIIIFLLGALQGFFGWFMVKSGLVNEPDVSHFRLALHLITAFLTFSYVFWVVLRLKFGKIEDSVENIQSIRKWVKFFLFALILQIIYGAFVAGLNAGFVYNTWPKMGSEWFPDSITAGESFVTNFIDGIAGVQFIHRYLAIALVIIFLFIFFKSQKLNLSKTRRMSIYIMAIALSIQFLLGVFTLLFQVPLALGVIHQVGAFILLTSTVYALFRFSKRGVKLN